MNHPLRLVLVFHNHQPIGNFDGVFEQAYQDSYLPFLDVFERYEQLRIAIHTSGSLMEWLDANHPEYVDRLAALVAAGRLEIVGGAYFEPILAMIPSRDRIGQITSYTKWLENRLGGKIRGMWMPERVWEQSMARDLAKAGIGYTILDDFHFKNAGLTQQQLHGYYVTEDDAQVINVLPGSEPLRYLLPFQGAEETIHYLRGVAEQHPGAVVVFGDDGEKFGTWPGTKEHVYDRGWLAQFFDALSANSDWLKVTTPTEAIDSIPPLGKLYIPEGSYREMTEWALPAAKINEFEDALHHLQDQGQWELIQPFVRGGYWRNFKVKYPETDVMYARMQLVSRRLHETLQVGAPPEGTVGELIDQARLELYRGQCNCSYWHGAFGGVYLPHLRNAVYQHLIAADNLLDQAENRGWQPDAQPWVTLDAGDFNLDGRAEARLANNRLTTFVAPVEGGQIYELDVKSICHNLKATLTRRPEAYHRKVLNGPSEGGDGVASIHDKVIFKQENLDQRLNYDTWRRNSLVDHFYSQESAPQQVAEGTADEQGDFVHGPYEAKLRRSPDRVQLQLSREGNVAGQTVRMTKGLTLNAAESVLEIAYLLEDLPSDLGVHFAPEWNFAGLPAGAEDRFFRDAEGNALGQLGERLDLHEATHLGLVDGWLGIDMGLDFDRPTSIWTYPVETVSQSEGGFELVHQSVAVVPHWQLVPDVNGCWSVTIRLAIDTQVAESRMAEVATSVAAI
ncbi:MAG: alpha-amylase/4-alpha-glucanotransferase domain-containing protein [Bythopirellula sp.]